MAHGMAQGWRMVVHCMAYCTCTRACACSGLEEARERLGGSELWRARFVDEPEVAREPRRRGGEQFGHGPRLHPHTLEAVARPVGTALVEECLVEPKRRRELPRRQRRRRRL